MSAPHSNGRQLIGVANVLSTISGTPWRWAAAANFSMSSTVSAGIGDGLAEHGLRVRAEGGVQLLRGSSPGRRT